jgi:hypothetical protein
MSTIAAPSPVTAALNEIETGAKHYATTRGALAERVARYQSEVEALQRRCLPAIKRLFAEASDAQAQVVKSVEAHPDLFIKPRTMQLHGIKLGFQKGKGGLTAVNEDDSIAKIEKLFGEDAPTYLNIKKALRVGSLLSLDGATLKKLGLALEETGDFVFVKAVDSEVDKLVTRLLKEGAVEEVEA